MLKKTFLENAKSSQDELSCDKIEYIENTSLLVSQDVRTNQSMCAYDAAEQESGLSKQVSAGMVRGGGVGSYAAVRQDKDYVEYKNIFDREKCVRDNGAFWIVLASQTQTRDRHEKLLKHGTKRRSGFQAGALVGSTSGTHSEVQGAVVDYMESPISKKILQKTDTVAKIVNKFGGGVKNTSEGQTSSSQKVLHTPKRKVNLLFIEQEKSDPIMIPKLSTCEGGRAGESPANRFKLCSLRSLNSDNG